MMHQAPVFKEQQMAHRFVHALPPDMVKNGRAFRPQPHPSPIPVANAFAKGQPAPVMVMVAMPRKRNLICAEILPRLQRDPPRDAAGRRCRQPEVRLRRPIALHCLWQQRRRSKCQVRLENMPVRIFIQECQPALTLPVQSQAVGAKLQRPRRSFHHVNLRAGVARKMIGMEIPTAIERKKHSIVIKGVCRTSQRRQAIIGRERVAQKPDAGQRPFAIIGKRVKVPPLIRPWRPVQPLHMRGIFRRIKDKTHEPIIPGCSLQRRQKRGILSAMGAMFLYQAAVALLALGLTGTALLNFWCFRKPRALFPKDGDADLPLISILVPARDEEANIEACVRSLLALNYPRFEVLVLDDHSSDDTYAILCRLRDQDFRLRVLIGASLPDGWYGKPFACWQMAQAAKGEYLLLTDADCVFAPDALLLALGARREHRADVVSLVPDLRCEGFWERLLIPLQYFVIFAFLPAFLIRKTTHPWIAAANGAFLFLTRDIYFAVDGHRAVRNQLAEDVKFAQHVKRQGKLLWYGDGSRTYSVRMYHGLPELWAGFSKNLFPAFSKNLPLLLGVIFLLLNVFVLPPLWIIWGWAAHAAWVWLPLATYLAMAGVRLGLTARFRRDAPEYALLNPLAWACVIGIAAHSAYRALSRHGNEWKGRVYVKD